MHVILELLYLVDQVEDGVHVLQDLLAIGTELLSQRLRFLFGLGGDAVLRLLSLHVFVVNSFVNSAGTPEFVEAEVLEGASSEAGDYLVLLGSQVVLIGVDHLDFPESLAAGIGTLVRNTIAGVLLESRTTLTP